MSREEKSLQFSVHSLNKFKCIFMYFGVNRLETDFTKSIKELVPYISTLFHYYVVIN